jgi:FkbM family methyltransferase
VEKNLIIVDVGSSRGEFALFVSNLSSTHKVYAIEPNPQSAQKISNGGGIEVRNLAIANVDHPETLKFSVSRNPELGSLKQVNPHLDREIYSAHMADVEFVEEIDVRTISLFDFFGEEDISTCDLLKVDAQGSDWEVILSARERIADVKIIALECAYEEKYSLYKDESNIETIIDGLDSLGFSIVWVVPNGGGEANLVAYNRSLGLSKYFELQSELQLLNAPCLKLTGNKLHSRVQKIRRKFWFIERRLRMLATK